MPKPFHSIAFEHFTTATPDPLEAMIAFGLFMDSENKWARLQPAWPTEAKYRNYHHVYLTPHEIQGYIAKARRVLKQFSDNLIEIERANFLSQALREYRQFAAVGDRRFRFAGVLEAIMGAFAWTVILFVFAIVLAWGGIDILEYYRRAAG